MVWTKKARQVAREKKIKCLACGEDFFRKSPSQKLCGSVKEKTGCSFKNKVKKRKERHKIRMLDKKYIDDRRKYRLKAKNMVRTIFSVYKRNSTQRNLDFKVDLSFFKKLWGTDCHYCGCKMETIGLDRVDNSVGYIESNLVQCCWTCNKMKNTMGIKDFTSQCVKISKNK